MLLKVWSFKKLSNKCKLFNNYENIITHVSNN